MSFRVVDPPFSRILRREAALLCVSYGTTGQHEILTISDGTGREVTLVTP